MYINTTANIGQTVYVYNPEIDCVNRGVVVAITVQETAGSTAVTYRVEGGAESFFVADEFIHTSPEMAFYRNPRAEQAPAQAELLAA